MRWVSIVWGIILILLGLSIIASKSGYLSAGFWLRLIDFWPLIFIIAGLGIISKSVKNRLPFILLIIVLIIVPFIVAIVNPVSYTTREERLEDVVVPFDPSIEEVWLTIEGGAGSFRISGGSNDITSGRFFSDYARLVKDITKTDKKLIIRYKTEGIFRRDIIVGSTKTEMDLLLNNSIPYFITLNLGASRLDLDFSSVTVRELKIDTGASSLAIKIGDKSPMQYISIKAGASDIDIRVPKDSGIRIRFDDGLTSKEFHNLEFIKKDKVYETMDYDSRDKKIELNISSGVSSIDIYGY